MKTEENHTCFSIFFSIFILISRLKLSDKEEENLPDAPDGERMATILMRAAKTTKIQKKVSQQHVFLVCEIFFV